MAKQRICPICGAGFEPTAPRQAYCSTACRRAGARAKRAAWIEKTGYRERDRKAHREREAKKKQAMAEQAALVRDRQDAEAASRLDRIRGDFLQKCEAGDPFSLMLKARQDGDLLEYWSQFSRYEIEEAEARGKKSSRTVNGVSVYDPLFAEKVAAIGEETQVYYSKMT